MSNPISLAFKKAKKEKRPALLTYTVAGDSSKKQSLEILKAISNYADILEVGVPHINQLQMADKYKQVRIEQSKMVLK